MAQTNVLAAGTTAANSTPTVITTSPVTLSMFTAAGGALPSGVVMNITKLNSSATYSNTGLVLASSPNSVTGMAQGIVTLTSPGTYRVERPRLDNTPAVGVDQDTTA